MRPGRFPIRLSPIVAKWFTGKIHLEVGEFDYQSQQANAVIIFDVENGIITKTTFAERIKRVQTWNGLPASSPTAKANPQQSPRGGNAGQLPSD